jgi:hypothetical protein
MNYLKKMDTVAVEPAVAGRKFGPWEEFVDDQGQAYVCFFLSLFTSLATP